MCTGCRDRTEQEVTAELVRQWERGGFAEEVMPGQILKHK